MGGQGSSAGIETMVSRWFIGFFVLMLGVSVGAGFASGNGNFETEVAVALTAFLLYASSCALGGVVGMLFGMPRSRLTDALNDGENLDASSTGSVQRSRYLTNSNFIKVSDWLTTIIIGLGLVNIQKLVPAAGSLRESLSEPLGGTAHAGVIGLGVIGVSFITGFILAFLWTMLQLKKLLEEVEQDDGSRTSERERIASQERRKPEANAVHSPVGPGESAK